MFERIKSILDETDIQTLVYAPALLGFGVLFILFLVLELLPGKPISESYIYIGVGIASIIECIAGVAEIYKKELPSSFGKIIKGNVAVISGLIIVVLFGFGGIVCIVHGISLLLSK